MAKKALANAAAAGIGSAPAPRASKASEKKTRTAASKLVDTMSVDAITVGAIETTSSGVLATAPDAHQQIAKIAYGYWAARGYDGGSQAEDWLRAEQEYLAGLR